MALNSVRLIFKVSSLTSPGVLQFSGKRFASATNSGFKHILTDKGGEKQNIGVITLNRPKVLNSLCVELMKELSDAFTEMDNDESIASIVLTGGDKVFAAGADVKEMSTKMYSDVVKTSLFNFDKDPSKCKKPVIAAVNGFCFGGGCELAMMCDIIYASEKAIFGQPEIVVGTIPGGGGTQKIARSCGKSKAMEMCLTGDPVPAKEAEKMGLISKVFPPEQVIPEAIKLGERIAKHSPLIVQLCKEAVNVAFESTLQEGLRFERKTFYATFATEDRKEGMSAFVEKRKPNFKNN